MKTTRQWWGGRLLEMTESECWELLDAVTVGRIAWCERGGPVVLPVNFTAHDGAVWLRTQPQSPIATAANHGDIAIQIDEADEFNRSGWSVLVRGHGELVAYGLAPGVWGDPEPWPEGSRPLLIRVVPHAITGRRLLPS